MIRRKNLISRHNPVLKADRPEAAASLDALTASPLTVGNGEFAFTADFTGLQTFGELYGRIPLGTMSQWGWHGEADDAVENDLRLSGYDTFGRTVGYASDSTGQQTLFDRLRQNPHKMHLGEIGFLFSDGTDASYASRSALAAVHDVEQTLDLWGALLHSRFSVSGKPVSCETLVDPSTDTLAVKIHVDSSWNLEQGELAVSIHFPYGSPTPSAAEWNLQDRHRTEAQMEDDHHVRLHRSIDRNTYQVALTLQGMAFRQTAPHRFVLQVTRQEAWATFRFSNGGAVAFPADFHELRDQATRWWHAYWNNGGVLQLHDSKDPRAVELERRIVLSQYLTAIQCAGSVPPAETGLTANSWYGKFHLEMHPWHAAHFPLWGHVEQLERSMDWYVKILPVARAIAASQGYSGARWPKMTDPSGRNAPSSIAVFLAWQQPHPILLSELIYQARPMREILEKYAPMVFETAEFIQSFLHLDDRTGRYVLGPPLIPAQETHLPETTRNPTFELSYFRWALQMADIWQTRLGQTGVRRFAEVARQLAPLPIIGDVYVAHAGCPDTFSKAAFTRDHPSMLGAMGFVPGDSTDPVVMRRTLEKVLNVWDRDTLWGWDFPMMAMTCVRLGLPDMAVDLLMMDAVNNRYLPNGHNPQVTHADLSVYLPGNGGLLLATGMMAAGCNLAFGQCDWQPGRCRLPGFPADGSWTVEAEGIRPYL